MLFQAVMKYFPSSNFFKIPSKRLKVPLVFGIILFYSLCENKKPDLLILQTIIRHNYRILRIICRCDVIITNTKNYL